MQGQCFVPKSDEQPIGMMSLVLLSNRTVIGTSLVPESRPFDEKE